MLWGDFKGAEVVSVEQRAPPRHQGCMNTQSRRGGQLPIPGDGAIVHNNFPKAEKAANK